MSYRRSFYAIKIAFIFVFLSSLTSCKNKEMEDHIFGNQKIEHRDYEYEMGEQLRGEDDNVIALTFDDGPSKWTPKVLDELKKHNVKATFFVVGRSAKRRPDIIKRIFNEGHDIGLHGYTHKSFTSLNNDEISNEIKDSLAVIKKIIPLYEVKIIRPPYGAINERVRNVIHNNNLSIVQWNVNTYDYYIDIANAEFIKQIVVEKASRGIVLMHDGGGLKGKKNVVNYLSTNLSSLSEKYKFVKITDHV